MLTHSPVVSVIIPVFNVRDYLSACLDSLLSQSFIEWQCVLVDDGSDDGSDAICDIYAARDSRFTVIHQPNSGPSAARNAGLSVASGEYLAFVDSDDILHEDYLQSMLQLCMDFDVPLVSVTMTRFSDGDIPHLEHPAISDRCVRMSGLKGAVNMLYQRRPPDCSPCGKLFHRSLLPLLKFEDGLLYEDLDLMPRVYAATEMVAVCDIPLYLYRRTPGSILMKFRLNRGDVLDVTARLHHYFAAKAESDAEYKPLVKAASDRRFSANCNIFLLARKERSRARRKGGDKTYIEALTKLIDRAASDIRRLAPSTLCDRNARPKNRLAALIVVLMRGLI